MISNYKFHTEADQVLLFADILDFSDIIYKYDTGNNIQDGLGFDFFSVYHGMSDYYSNREYIGNTKVNFLWMSDSIVLSGKPQDVDNILEEFFNIQRVLYTGGMALRGAMCIDRLYHEDNVWGKALVRAAYLEKEISKYPRIIIPCSDFIKLPSESRLVQQYFITPNESDELDDNYLYLDPITPHIDSTLSRDESSINSLIQVFTDEFNTNLNKSPIEKKDKWGWLIERFISALRSNKELIEERLKKEQEDGTLIIRIENVIDDCMILLKENKN